MHMVARNRGYILEEHKTRPMGGPCSLQTKIKDGVRAHTMNPIKEHARQSDLLHITTAE
jgi:hypothetical protein